MYHKGTTIASSLGNAHCIENWGDSGMADNSQQTDTSTDVDTDDRNQVFFGVSFSANMLCFFFICFIFFCLFSCMGIFFGLMVVGHL